MVISQFPPGISSHAIFSRTKDDIFEGRFDGNSSQHRIMAEFFALEYAKAMAEMTQIGTAADYLFWVYDGLGVDPSAFLTPSQITSMNNNWEAIRSSVEGVQDEEGNFSGGYEC